MVELTGIEPVALLCNPLKSLKSLNLFIVQDSTSHHFVYFFTVNIIIWIYKTGQIISQDTLDLLHPNDYHKEIVKYV